MERMHREPLKNERRIGIYTPPGFSRRSQPYPLLILLDGWPYLKRGPTTTILESSCPESDTTVRGRQTRTLTCAKFTRRKVCGAHLPETSLWL